MNWKSVSLLAVTGFLLCATSSLSDYLIPVSVTSEGGGAGSAQQYELIFTMGQPSPVGFSTASTYSLTSGLIPALSDVQPPDILHEPALLVPERTSVELEAHVSDDRAGVEMVTVYYHEGGVTAFRERQMQPGEEDLFTTALPPSSVTERGLVYYLEAKDRLGNTSRYPAGAPDSLISLRVYFSDLESAIELPAGHYRMISLPGSSNGDPDTVLVDDFGIYDRSVWRLGRWNAGDSACVDYCYDEYPRIEDFYPGRSFWLISSEPKRFDFSGISVDIARPFVVHLEEGWNQIATPFAFATDWLSVQILFDGGVYSVGEQHIVGADTIYVEDNLISYDGAYHGLQSWLLPWTGYWIYNSSTQEVDLLMHPEIPPTALAQSRYGGHEIDLLLDLSVGSGGARKGIGMVGMSPAADDGWDVLDHHEPPPVGDYLRVVFEKDRWGPYSGTYMSDMRRSSKDGAFWDFCVQTARATSAVLDVEPIVDIPEDWHFFVYDVDAGIRLNPSVLPYRFKLDRNRRFMLIAGTDEYIRTEEAQSKIDLKTQIVSISPNPFRQNVRISFFIPRRERARLQIFSVEGRLVTKLVDSVLDGGLHTATWQGTSDNRTRVGPGIYFLRLEFPDEVRTAKVLKVW